MNTLLVVIIALVLLEYAVNTTLSWLNGRRMGWPIPASLKGLYDDEQYRRQQDYMRANRRLGRWQRTVTVAIDVLILSLGIYGAIDDGCKEVTQVAELQLMIFLFVFQFINELVELPFAYYGTFVVEERFGFNKSTHRTFALDVVKSFVLSYLLTALLVVLVYEAYAWLGSAFWVVALAVCTVITLFMTWGYSVFIVPRFNKQTPLPAGELRTAIERAVQAFGAQFSEIYVIDGSRRSTKANAYFTGIGSKKRIVLYDTLIEQMTTDEVVAVLAHEFGHFRHHDMWRNMAQSIVMMGVFLYVLSWLVGSSELPEALGGHAPSFVLSMLAFGYLMTPINMLLAPLGNALSRRAERAADAYAAQHGHAAALVSALKKLSANALINLTPHPAVVWMDYSHPTLAQRVEFLQNIAES